MVGGGDGASAEPAEGDGSGFAVERILRSFKRRGTSFYIVKWAGFEERTIEPAGVPRLLSRSSPCAIAVVSQLLPPLHQWLLQRLGGKSRLRGSSIGTLEEFHRRNQQIFS